MGKTIRIRKKAPAPQLEPVDALSSWLEANFVIPSGISRGQPFRLHDFQRAFLADHLANADDNGPAYRTVILSCPRKLGKTSLLAALVVAYMSEDSPLFVPGWRGAIAGPTEAHAQMLLQAVADLLDVNGRSNIKYRRSPKPGSLAGDGSTSFQALTGSPTQGHGLSLDLAVIDEAGLLKENSEVMQNLLDACAARDGRMVITGTRGTSAQYREKLERPDPSTCVHLYSASLDADPGDRKLWHAVNPGLGDIKSERFMSDAYEQAKAAGTTVAFMAWQLNAPVDPMRQLVIEYSDLSACYDEDAEPIPGEPVWLGLDLGGAASMTAAVAVFESGVIRSLGAFPSAAMTLAERGKRDGVGLTWQECAKRGELKETTGHVSELTEFVPHVLDMIQGHPVVSVTGDRFRDAELRNALAKCEVTWPLQLRATGPKDGNADILALRRFFLARKARLKRSLLLEASLAEADCRVAATGALSLDRAHRDGRNDLAAALILAAGSRMRDLDRPQAEVEVHVL